MSHTDHPVSTSTSSRGKRKFKSGNNGSALKKKIKGKTQANLPSYVQEGDKCVVCGDKSTGIHYHAMTCEGCKGFFRRITQKSKGAEPNLICKKEKNCTITPETRNDCQFCRYNMCVRMKMDPSSVLNDIDRGRLRELIVNNKIERERRKSRTMSTEEWNKLRQIGKSYKSPFIQTFFIFYPMVKDKTSEPKGFYEGMSPALWHAYNFARNIADIYKIDKEDFLKLVVNRLIDVLAIMLSEVFDAAKSILCFSNIWLQENDVTEVYPQFERIFKYAKTYSKFVTEDGMILGCLCAMRFLNSDGLELHNSEAPSRALNNIMDICHKYFDTLGNETLIRELYKGLPNFENIYHFDKMKLLRIAMMNLSFRKVESHLEANPLQSHSFSSFQDYMSSPECATSSTSTAPSLRSPFPSTTSEDNTDSESLKLEINCNEDYVERQSGEEYRETYFETTFKQPMSVRDADSEVAEEGSSPGSILSIGRNNVSWQGTQHLYSPAASSTSSDDNWSQNRSHFTRASEPMLVRMNTYEPDIYSRNLGIIHERPPRSEFQGGYSYHYPYELKYETHILTPRPADNMITVDSGRIQVPQSSSFHPINDVSDVENLRKNNAELKEVVKHLFHLVESQGINPDWDSIWKAVQEKNIPLNLQGSDIKDVMHEFTSSFPHIVQPQHFPQELNILHHPEVSKALSSPLLSYARDSYSYKQHYSFPSPPIAHKHSPSSSYSSDSFQPLPDLYKNPEHGIISENFSPINQFRIQTDFQSFGHNRPFWQDLHQDKPIILNSNFSLNNVSATQVPGETAFCPPNENRMSAFVSQSQISTSAFHNPTKSSFTPLVAHSPPTQSSPTLPSDASFSLNVPHEQKHGPEICTFETIDSKSHDLETTNHKNSFKPKDADHTSYAYETVNPQSYVPESADCLQTQTVPVKKVHGVKKMWLQAHLQSMGVR